MEEEALGTDLDSAGGLEGGEEVMAGKKEGRGREGDGDGVKPKREGSVAFLLSFRGSDFACIFFSWR